MNKPISIDFRAPSSVAELAEYIGIQIPILQQLLDSDDPTEFYSRHLIPKRSARRANEMREVWEVAHPFLVGPHKAFARRFELFARLADPRFPHEAAFGYVRGRGIRDNAQVHCGSRLLLRADLRNFFPSISADRIRRRVIELGVQPEPAVALAKFSTIRGRLALGLNASPMLANLICVDLDEKLHDLAERYACKYTRYADDISISGSESLPIRDELATIVEGNGFVLSDRKFRVSKIGQAHYVTGLSISDRLPHAPRRMKRRIRQELYYCKRYGIHQHLSRCYEEKEQRGINRIDGTVRYVAFHDPLVGERLVSTWRNTLELEGAKPSYETKIERGARFVACFVDETEFVFGNRRFLALGLVFTEDPNTLRVVTWRTLREHQVDPFASGDKDALRVKGLHFADSHFDLRTGYLRELARLDFRGFIIYAELKTSAEYSATYLALLCRVLPHRLIWYDQAAIEFTFEENSKVNLESIKKVVSDAYGLLAASGSRRPILSYESV